MREITRIETNDGKEHETVEQAKKHLDKVATEIINKLAGRVHGIGRVCDIADTIRVSIRSLRVACDAIAEMEGAEKDIEEGRGI